VTGSEAQARRELLADLLELRHAPHTAAAAVRAMPWDSDSELVVLSRAHVLRLLQRYLRGELESSDLETWADAVEARDDIGYEHDQDDALRAFVFETANPTLAEPISPGYADRWIRRLGGNASTYARDSGDRQ
jgi:hypothetical protein